MNKKFVSLLLAALMFCSILIVSPAAFAEELPACPHEWSEGVVITPATCQQEGSMVYTCTLCGETKTEAIEKTAHSAEPVFTKEPTVSSRGAAVLKCTECGCYKAKSNNGEFWTSVETNRWIIKYNCYKPYTLSYKYSLDGAGTRLGGTYRIVSITNDLYGGEGIETVFPEIPQAPVPAGYTVSQFESTRYAVLENGVPGASFTPGNDARCLYSWMNDTDTNYEIIALYIIDEPQVVISQSGLNLKAEINNRGEGLDYSFQWYKNGAVLKGETGQSLNINAADAGAKFSVTVTAAKGTGGNIALLNEKAAQGSAELVTDDSFTVVFDSNGGNELSPVEKKPGDPFGSLPNAGNVNGMQNMGWYMKNSDGSVSSVSVSENSLVPGDCVLFQKRQIKTPDLKITRDRSPYNYTGEPVTLTAKFTECEALEYTVQWSKDGAEIAGANGKDLKLAGVVSDSGTYSVTVTAKLKDGLTVISENESVSITATDKPLTIRRTNNQLLYNPNGGSGGPNNNMDYIKDGRYVAVVEKRVPIRQGYVFTGWNTMADGSGDKYMGGDFYEFLDESGNGGLRAVLYAQWEPQSYTLRFDTAGGTAIDPVQVRYGEPVGALPVPRREGYKFLGWLNENKDAVTAESIYSLQSDSVLTASWAKTYIITFNYNGGKKDIESMTVVYGEPIGNLPATSKEGALFAGWYDAKNQPVRAGDIYNVDGDSVLTAGWADPDARPKTGDEGNAVLWLALLLLSGAAAVISLPKFRRR